MSSKKKRNDDQVCLRMSQGVSYVPEDVSVDFQVDGSNQSFFINSELVE